jgi:hypothetical protein
MRIKRYLGVLGLLVLGALALAAPAASADVCTTGNACTPEDSLSAVFTGTTTALVPPVKWVGGAGTFTFAGNGTCVFNDLDPVGEAPPPDPAGPVTTGPVPCQFNATGTYANIVCGTGSADGTATIKGGPEGDVHAQFHLQFAGGVGALVVNDHNADDSDPDGSKEWAVGGGGVDITPNGPGDPTPPDPTKPDGGDCVHSFGVAGTFGATLWEPLPLD